MDLGLPTGVRDYRPDAAARLTAAAARLADVFSAWGYRRVIVPTIERVAVVSRGLGPEAQARLFQAVEPGTGEVVAVAPDHTAQVARLWASSLAGVPPPVRVSYVAPVLRAREERAGRPREVYQAGVELLGAGGPAADAEVVALCARALHAAGAADLVVDLGHAGFVKAFLEAAAVPEELRGEVRALLARKDAASLERLVAGLGRAPAEVRKARRGLIALPGLYGQGTLDRARKASRKAGVGEGAVAEVEAVLAALEPLELPARVTVDLGESRGFGYYTGLTLHAFAPGVGAEIAAGGRYDDLLGRYGRPAPAVGVAVDVGLLAEAVGGEASAGAGVLLLGGGRPVPELFAAAERLRRTGRAVTLLPTARRGADGLAYARAHGLGEVLVPRAAGRFQRLRAEDGEALGDLVLNDEGP